MYEYQKEMNQCRFNIHARHTLVKQYAWAVPNKEAIAECRKYLPLVEIGAGNGYWAHLIKGDMYCYDNAVGTTLPEYHAGTGRWYYVEPGDPLKIADHPNCNLFLCWPPYNSEMAYQCLKNFKNKYVIYVGEGEGGCTGDELFHTNLKENFKAMKYITIPQWDGIHDYLSVWERKCTTLNS